MSILEDLDVSQWSDTEVKAALDFLYGDAEKFFDQIVQLNLLGDHKPRTEYLGYEEE